MKRAIPCAAWLASVACAADDRLLAISELLPMEVDWAVLAVVSENEAEATALLPREGGVFRGELPGAVSSGTVWLSGYTDAEIRALTDLDATQLASTLLQRARTGEPRLPAPAFSVRGPWSDERPELVLPSAGEMPPPLTASWLPRCPSLVTDKTRVRVAGLDPCGATATQVGCRLTIDIGSCGVGVSGDLVAGGVSVLEGTGEYTRCESGPEEPRRFSCELRGSGTDEIELVEAEAPVFEVDLFTVSDDQFEPDRSIGYPYRSGSVHGPALVGDRVVLSRTAGAAVDCETQSPSSDLAFIDRASGAIVHTATAPPCLIFLQSEPERETFLGFTGLYGATSAHRFDAEGRLLQSVDLLASSGEVPTIDSVRVLEDEVVIVLRFYFAPQPEPSAELIVLARNDLTERLRRSELPRAPYQAFDTGETYGLIGGSLVHFFDPASGEEVDQWTTSRASEGCLPGGIRSAEWDSSSRRVLAPEQRDLNRVAVVTRDSCRTVAFYEWAAAPLDMAPTSLPNVWLVSLNGTDRISPGVHDNSGVAELDLDTMSFRPRALRFGRGPVRGLIADADGVIWASVQWTGQLARIRQVP